MVLEMDELNQHECMASMTALIGHMQRNGITPRVEQVSGTLQVAHTHFTKHVCMHSVVIQVPELTCYISSILQHIILSLLAFLSLRA